MNNGEVADVLEEIGDMLEIQGENPFKIKAYRRAARTVRGYPEDINTLFKRDAIETLEGIGKGISEKIKELIKTGQINYYEELKEEVPPSILLLMQVPGVGPRKAKLFYDELRITNIGELLEAANSNKIRHLKGMGERTEEKLIESIKFYQKSRERMLLFEALPVAETIVAELKDKGVTEIEMVGSLRRRKETIKDIDILAASTAPKTVIDYFCRQPAAQKVLECGKTRVSVILKNGIRVDLRVMEKETFGSALQHLTGSKEHNAHLRKIAKRRGLKINEYGVFRGNEKIGGKTEKENYEALGMVYIEPYLREDMGEIEAAAENLLPESVKESDIQGDLHVHSSWSDGHGRIKEIALEAKNIGYEYIAICDHAQRLKVAGGIGLDEIKLRTKEIEDVNKEFTNFHVLNGIELNIENDGSLDYPDTVLSGFDIVIASVHWGFNQPEEQLTERVIKAMQNPHVDIVAHPTGRILGKRNPYNIDLDKVFMVAQETSTYLELNAFPDRLDLRDVELKKGKEKYGLRYAVNTDAHSVSQLYFMRYGIYTAQRGWLRKEDVINTQSFNGLLDMLKKQQ